eukprot:c19892_g1_i1.p1 GENE.c19892_g1_i1~~c19892_g1_i1.p1  ORF type:complete len:529 (+),score=217.24 c19892_g1_i1:675-2261(+)
MLSPVLILTAIVVVGLVIGINIWILKFYEHKDEYNKAHLTKFVVIAGLTCSELLVLMLPFDIQVSSFGEIHAQNMEILWQFMYFLVGFLLVVIVPFALFYYESENPENPQPCVQTLHGLQISVCALLVVFLTTLVLYMYIGVAEIPIVSYTSTFEPSSSSSSIINYGDIPVLVTEDYCSRHEQQCNGNLESIELDVTYSVFIMGFVSFIGWFFFVSFAGVGLPSIPIDLLVEFQNRPQKLSEKEFIAKKEELNQRAKQVKIIADQLVAKDRTKNDTVYNKQQRHTLRKMVYLLEKDWKRLLSTQNSENGTLIYWFYLLLSIITAILSLCWLIHIILFMFLDPSSAHPFLNNLFISLDTNMSLGTFCYGLFAFFLICATIKGNMKVGLRFVCLPIHPMQHHGTMMNSFLFNVELILLGSVAVVQFCVSAFALYAHNSAIEHLLSIQVSNLKFINNFFVNDVFLYALIIISGLSFLVLLICPTDKPFKHFGGGGAGSGASASSLGNSNNSIGLGLGLGGSSDKVHPYVPL